MARRRGSLATFPQVAGSRFPRSPPEPRLTPPEPQLTPPRPRKTGLRRPSRACAGRKSSQAAANSSQAAVFGRVAACGRTSRLPRGRAGVFDRISKLFELPAALAGGSRSCGAQQAARHLPPSCREFRPPAASPALARRGSAGRICGVVRPALGCGRPSADRPEKAAPAPGEAARCSSRPGRRGSETLQFGASAVSRPGRSTDASLLYLLTARGIIMRFALRPHMVCMVWRKEGLHERCQTLALSNEVSSDVAKLLQT